MTNTLCPQIIRPGHVTVTPDGNVHVGDDFDFEFHGDKSPLNFSGCQEAFHVGAAWAIQQIAHAMTPAGFMKGGIGAEMGSVPREQLMALNKHLQGDALTEGERQHLTNFTNTLAQIYGS